MAEPTQDQVQIANEVLAGTRQITGSASVSPPQDQGPSAPAGLSEEARQQAVDIGVVLDEQMRDGSQPREPYPDLAVKQWAFERSVAAEDIQRTNDMHGPGE